MRPVRTTLLRMDAERVRAHLLSLPHVVETMQWGENLVFWVGDKAVGGKMFALINLDGGPGPVMSFASGGEHAAELCEREGIIPAPYLARAGWVAAQGWDALRSGEWTAELSLAHARVLAKLPARALAVLAMPAKVRGALIEQRRQMLAEKSPIQKRATKE